MLGLGLKLGRLKRISGFDADALNYINALTNNGMDDSKSNTLYGFNYATLKGHIDDFFVGLKDNSLFSKIDILYLHIGDDATLQGINAKNPGTNDVTFFNTVGGDFTATGWQGNGSNSYGNTSFNTTSLTDTDNHLMTYSRTSTAANTCALGVEGGASDYFMFPQLASGNIQYRVDGVNLIDAITDGSGMIIGTTRTSTDHETYRNDSTVGTSSSAITSIPAGNIYIGARNDTTSSDTAISISAREFIAFSVGAGLTDTDVTNYTNTMNTLQTALGRNTF